MCHAYIHTHTHTHIINTGKERYEDKAISYTSGDIVGFGYSEQKAEVFFTKNGRLVKTLASVPKTTGTYMYLRLPGVEPLSIIHI